MIWFMRIGERVAFWYRMKLFAAKSLQSCPTLCDPLDSSPPGSPIPGILQARTLEWVAISFSNAWKWKVKVKSLSRVWLFATTRIAAHQAPPPMGFSRQEYWSGVPMPSPKLFELFPNDILKWLPNDISILAKLVCQVINNNYNTWNSSLLIISQHFSCKCLRICFYSHDLSNSQGSHIQYHHLWG